MIQIENYPPFSQTWSVAGWVHEYDEVTLSSDVQTVTIDWGDGSPLTVITDVIPNKPEDPFDASHEYPFPTGNYTIVVTAYDDDTGFHTVTEGAVVDALRIAGVGVEEHYWGDDDNTWYDAGDSIWTSDEHRWTTGYLPTEAMPTVWLTEWFAEVWVGQTEPLVIDNDPFATADGAIPALGTLPAGDWYVYAVAHGESVQAEAPGERIMAYSQSVEWEGVDPGDGQTNLFIPDEGPLRIYPEQNRPANAENGAGEPLDQNHDKINIPADRANENLYVRIFDPDNSLAGDADPNDDEAPNKPVDNLEGGGDQYSLGITPGTSEFTFLAGGPATETEVLTITKPQPGNNFLAVAHHTEATFAKLFFREDGLTLFYFFDMDKRDVPAAHLSPLLEVWRTLWVESDHMGSPDAHGATPGTFGGVTDDVSMTPPKPTIEMLGQLLYPAKVFVAYAHPEDDTRDETLFVHNKSDTTVHPPVRDIESAKHFWHIHMLGAYEWKVELDNDNEVLPDTNTEDFLVGWSEPDGNDPTNFVFYETIRDIHAEPQLPGMVELPVLEDRVSAHEALHRFFGWHGTRPEADEGIMHAPTAMTEETIVLTGRQIQVIQKTTWPK
ncbi:MAG: hypothetical protein WD872_05300 [Pirellulaceae bacterium]